ncbi:MAG: lipopolysaccharide biosynthesis protein [Marinospirillum sp.]|uniref:Wzz/FepE/Etk N-terminal domain-containing protein n=1 Tax=Marinospirillum sp. TaxID=2183934 RepID=UPI0019F36022|nr:Wzz/FepE/Etk N-terminal domain-containing protein [Marinospirillum sp.]MBE0506134.1 lipopolysaccharide biosynthesis protein [Marinospirillum sp.]
MNNTNQTQLPESMQQRDAQFHPYPDDEISLVDLAKILIKRRWTLLVTATVVVIMALVFALLREPNYTYTSIYKIAEIERGEALEAVQSLIEQAQNLYWPNVSRAYQIDNNLKSMPFKLAVNNPKDTLLILLSSEASEISQAKIEDLHQQVIEALQQQQQQAVKTTVERLQRQTETTQKLLDQAAQSESEKATDMIAGYTERLFALEDRLQSLQPGQVLQVAAAGERAKSVGKSLILALGIVLGGILGIMAAFFAEFAARVRQSLKEDQQ